MQSAIQLWNKSVISHLWQKMAITPQDILNLHTDWIQGLPLPDMFNCLLRDSAVVSHYGELSLMINTCSWYHDRIANSNLKVHSVFFKRNIQNNHTGTEAMEAHFFTPGIKFDDAKILSSAASVRVSSEAVQKIMNSDPVRQTRFLCKKASLRGLRNRWFWVFWTLSNGLRLNTLTIQCV